MSATITKVNGQCNASETREFLISSATDVAKLPKSGTVGTLDGDTVVNRPCAIGSTALLATGSATEVYILSPDNTWVKM